MVLWNLPDRFNSLRAFSASQPVVRRGSIAVPATSCQRHRDIGFKTIQQIRSDALIAQAHCPDTHLHRCSVVSSRYLIRAKAFDPVACE
jgi:hypothetical protein